MTKKKSTSKKPKKEIVEAPEEPVVPSLPPDPIPVPEPPKEKKEKKAKRRIDIDLIRTMILRRVSDGDAEKQRQALDAVLAELGITKAEYLEARKRR